MKLIEETRPIIKLLWILFITFWQAVGLLIYISFMKCVDYCCKPFKK